MTDSPAGSAAAELEIDLTVESGDWPGQDELEALAQKAIATSVRIAELNAMPGSEVSLLLTDDAAIRELNNRWRDKDKPTNVLSFPGSDPSGDVYGPMLGDIVFAFETIRREADELGIDFSDHFTHLVVHGILHLFDYDHQEDDEAEKMESLERAILATLNIADPYQDRPLLADDQ